MRKKACSVPWVDVLVPINEVLDASGEVPRSDSQQIFSGQGGGGGGEDSLATQSRTTTRQTVLEWKSEASNSVGRIRFSTSSWVTSLRSLIRSATTVYVDPDCVKPERSPTDVTLRVTVPSVRGPAPLSGRGSTEIGQTGRPQSFPEFTTVTLIWWLAVWPATSVATALRVCGPMGQ